MRRRAGVNARVQRPSRPEGSKSVQAGWIILTGSMGADELISQVEARVRPKWSPTDHLARLQLLDLPGVDAEELAQDLLIVLTEERGGRTEPSIHGLVLKGQRR